MTQSWLVLEIFPNTSILGLVKKKGHQQDATEPKRGASEANMVDIPSTRQNQWGNPRIPKWRYRCHI